MSRETIHQVVERGLVGEVRVRLWANSLRRLAGKGRDEVNSRGLYGETPLHIAAAGSRDHRIVEMLLASGAEVNARNESGRTPLHIAIYIPSYLRKDYKILKNLLAKGADPNAADNSGDTPLALALHEGDSEVVKILLASGARVNARGHDESTPFHTAAYYGRVENMKLLLSGGAEINATDRESRTPLHIAAEKRNPEAVEFLLTSGAEAGAIDRSGRTPLHIAAETNDWRVTERLLAGGAEVDPSDDDGNTPLFRAARAASLGVAVQLLAHGADENRQNKHGDTPRSVGTNPRTYAKDRESTSRLVLRCQNCETTFEPGLNAICITAKEMAELVGAAALHMGINIMIGLSRGADPKRLEKDKELILLQACEGWTCQVCHHKNEWSPDYKRISAEAKSGFEGWKESGEPEVWIWNHFRGWDEDDWTELVTSIRESGYWRTGTFAASFGELNARQYIESLSSRFNIRRTRPSAM